MALIKCPECGKEISDKAPACIYCGCPVESGKTEDTSNCVDKVGALFNDFLSNPVSHGSDLNSIYDSVRKQVLKIRTTENVDSEQSRTQQGNVAEEIIQGIIKYKEHCNWMTCKKFCELIDFDSLPEASMDGISDALYEIISVDKVHNDGSKGNSYHIIFAYPLFEIITHGSESNKSQLMSILDKPSSLSGTRYSDMLSVLKRGIGNPRGVSLDSQEKQRLKEDEQRINDAYSLNQKDTEPDRQKATIARLKQTISAKRKAIIGFIIAAIVITPLLIWACANSVHGDLGVVIVILFFSDLICIGMLISSVNELNRAQSDLEIAEKDIAQYEEISTERAKQAIAELQKSLAAQAAEHPACPNCGSKNTKRITTANRMVSIGTVGLASSKIGKQYECKNCKHKW